MSASSPSGPEMSTAPGASGGPASPSDAASEAAAPPVAEGAEDPRRRASRLRRRRRLLALGAAPALAVTIVSAWMAFLFLMTLAANRAAIAGDYSTAVSRYETVARADPWLEKWRVRYNLGTARLLAGDEAGAVSDLTRALEKAPAAQMVPVQAQDGSTTQVRDPSAPECLVRINLYAAHLGRAQKASQAGDEAGARAATDEAESAAGECPVPPPPDPSPSSSPSPSTPPSADPSGTPSSDPSASSSADPSSDPSASASASSSSDPSSSAAPSSDSTPSAGTTPSASPSPADPQRDKLEERNRRANGSQGPDSGGRRW